MLIDKLIFDPAWGFNRAKMKRFQGLCRWLFNSSIIVCSRTAGIMFSAVESRMSSASSRSATTFFNSVVGDDRQSDLLRALNMNAPEQRVVYNENLMRY